MTTEGFTRRNTSPTRSWARPSVGATSRSSRTRSCGDSHRRAAARSAHQECPPGRSPTRRRSEASSNARPFPRRGLPASVLSPVSLRIAQIAASRSSAPAARSRSSTASVATPVGPAQMPLGPRQQRLRGEDLLVFGVARDAARSRAGCAAPSRPSARVCRRPDPRQPCSRSMRHDRAAVAPGAQDGVGAGGLGGDQRGARGIQPRRAISAKPRWPR